ncbi:MAG: zinc-ribbon domain-containing protein [Myxococcales bacterium]|nr:zinc-ribbon domain-containing protein [Myxococcales bacterium]
MKIVCDSCGAKYSIADEKVAGKIFKIRCKKCSSVLEVRGDQTAAQALEGASHAQEPIPDGGWYIVVEGEQRGPLPPIELSQLFAKGSVALDSYVWKEGFDDWRVAGDIPELVQILGGVGSTRPSQTDELATDSTTSIGGGGDLFGDTNGREPTGEIETHGNAFTGFDESPAGVDSPAEASLAASHESDPGALGGVSGGPGGGAMGGAPARMTGQRNENSVLFSLSNLQQLATRGGSPGNASPEPAPAQPAAGGEGSGLIDIRALARSTTPGTKTAPSQAVDDLLAIGASPGAGALGGPLLGPAPMESADGNRWLWIAGALIAMIAIVGTGFAVGMAFGGSEDDGLEVAGQAPVEAVPGSNAAATATQAPTPSSDTAAAIAAPEPEEAAQFEEPPEEPLEAPELEEPAVEKPTTSTRQSATTTQRRTRLKNATAAPTTTPAPTKKRGGNNLDALMDEVVGGSSSGPKKTATTTSKSSSPDSSLPDAPSRNDVKTALQGVSGGVKTCRQDSGGTAAVDVTFSGSTGRVSRAKVTSGPFKGTPVGQCVERAVKRARVPRFKQSSFKVKFPYRL